MLDSRAFGLRKSIGLVLFGFIALVALGYPHGAAAMRRHHGISAGVQVRVSDYDYLSDYGEWVEVPRFGVVWQPYVVDEWEPFFHGHWSWTNDGWAWISYEPFGWMVYHYGYWYHRPHIGWFWVPGRIWSPARVQWYTFGDYCAWAPLPPPNFYWPDPWDRHEVNIWVVVNINNFTDENIGRHRIVEPFRRETFEHRTIVKRAPAIRRVEEITKRTIPTTRIVKQRSDIRPEAIKPSTRSGRPGNTRLNRMVLPESDRAIVKQHAPQVEREVLTPRKSAPTERQQAPERKSGEIQKRKVKRR